MKIEQLEYKNIRVGRWLATSESVEGAFYSVNLDGDYWTCSCPHNKNTGKECKHIHATQEMI